MECPNCATNIPALKVLSAKSYVVTCDNCKRKLRVKGLMTALVIFLILGAFVGFPYPDNIAALMSLVLVETVLLYAILFFLCVQLVVVD